jgi:hypothetical protein
MRRVLLTLLLIVLTLAARARLAALQVESDFHPNQKSSALPHYPNCRFGAAAPSDISPYDTASLNLGWYVNWGISLSPDTPGGLEFVQTVRLVQSGSNSWDFKPGQSWTSLSNAVTANPGVIWLIGNEPDSPYQDDMAPEAYAYAYHDVYHLIKSVDPAAQVGIGGVVQPTPLRFEYLDRVWNTYSQTYSETMPVDLWNIHTFILRETTVLPDPEPCGPDTFQMWGAYIPPGSTAQTGELYCVRDQDSLDIFWQRIRDFRQWMADKGERDKPLIVTEHGILFPEDEGYPDEDGIIFSQVRVGSFMTSTFELMLNETDPYVGYPYDGNRLVQRWIWFSLAENPNAWGGTLFDPEMHTLRPLGQTCREYTNAITPTVDLLAARAYADPVVYQYEGQPVAATLKAVVSNAGNISTTRPITVTFYDGPPGEAGTNPIGAAQVIVGGLQGCADYEVVQTEWPGLGPGARRFYVEVSGGDGDSPANNVAEGLVLIATHRVFLPAVPREY